ncbi:MAG TPA: hypothetical protein VF463_12440 [Sphingobium sp.]
MAMRMDILIESRMRDALEGDAGACFDLGIAHSCGTAAQLNCVEAYKWFDLAVSGGYALAGKYRAQIAQAMSSRQIAEARRRLRQLELSQARQVARFSASLFA